MQEQAQLVVRGSVGGHGLPGGDVRPLQGARAETAATPPIQLTEPLPDVGQDLRQIRPDHVGGFKALLPRRFVVLTQSAAIWPGGVELELVLREAAQLFAD